MIKVFQFLMENGISFAEALRQYDNQGFSDMGNDKADTSGAVLGICAEGQLLSLLKYLWSDDFVQFWTPDHYAYLYEEMKSKNVLSSFDF